MPERWNKSTHTFIAIFGEITVTLEDVDVATLLPILGDLDPRTVNLDADEQAIEASLLAAHSKISAGKKFNNAKTVKLFNWLQCYGKLDSDIVVLHRRAILVLLWLSKFVFGGFPGDRVLIELVRVDIKLFRGFSLPLAPLVLGTLYHQLDTFFDDEMEGGGFFLIETVVCYPLLHGGFTLGGYPHACLWISKKVSVVEYNRLYTVFDDIKEFTWQPYYDSPDYVIQPRISSILMPTGSAPGEITVTDADLSLLEAYVCVTPRPLPFLSLAGSFGVTSYRLDRVMRQFGHDQGIQ
ncbi:hypothetical protein CCACVL1_19164 [Corchorus capsularis]|uniref:Aminotransferase-like plant mobile domain-containing protein n=1 Tax=Corchorus capsularis TaxID=210143 RepID=A0A1R3HI90_COCAP|nr:hypothetical protein CCACVL1_19164 [Corchorus capsularis]